MIEHLNQTVWATLAPSPIHGIGVFAIRDIPAGTVITDYTNETLGAVETHELTAEEFELIDPAIKPLILDRTIFTEDLIRFTSPNTEAVLRSFMNHSDTPNTDGVRTLTDVQAGEELTEDFRTLAADPHPLTKRHMPFIWS